MNDLNEHPQRADGSLPKIKSSMDEKLEKTFYPPWGVVWPLSVEIKGGVAIVLIVGILSLCSLAYYQSKSVEHRSTVSELSVDCSLFGIKSNRSSIHA